VIVVMTVPICERLKREYSLQVRRLGGSNGILRPSKGRHACHPHVAITPGLLCHPFDEIITVITPINRVFALRFPDSAHIGDYLDIAPRNEIALFATFMTSVSSRGVADSVFGPCGKPLRLFAIPRERDKPGKCAFPPGTVYVDAHADSVPHGNPYILFKSYVIHRLGSKVMPIFLHLAPLLFRTA
jgi:hypothetical protein